MNKKARKIGMTNSTFATPSGQGTSNLTTANDMLKCTVYANTYSIRRYAGVRSATIDISGTDTLVERNVAYENVLIPDYIPV